MLGRRRARTDARRTERGQAIIYVVLMLGLFLLAAIGFAVDLGNMWFHRQAAQTAADSACVAGAMDMLNTASGGLTTSWWTTSTADGTTVDCTSTTPNIATTVPSPCWYAARNGYASPGLSSGISSNRV